MFQFAEIDPKHPYAKVTYMLSAVVTLFGRIFPDLGKGRFSTSAVVLMLLLTFIKIAGMASILGKPMTPFVLFFSGSLTAILSLIDMFQYIVFASVILSWVIMLFQVMHPLMELIMQMAEPIVAPFRKITPNLGMLDFSTLVAILVLALLEMGIRIVGGNILSALV
ncbi:YggT family protein [Moraxella caprae]|nr:YggT family protein [Moraxella caprae]